MRHLHLILVLGAMLAVANGKKATATEVLLPELPHSQQAELAVLGAVVVDNGHLHEVSRLKPHDFFLPQNREIFECMLRLEEDSRPIDSLTLSEELLRCGRLQVAGGNVYLASIGDGVPRVVNVAQYVEAIRNTSLLRQIAHTSELVQRQALSGEEDAGQLLTRFSSTLIELAVEAELTEDESSYRDAAIRLVKGLDAETPPVRAFTGIEELDEKTGGLLAGELVVVTAGDTGVGKAQPIEAKVLTPYGWKEIGKLQLKEAICSPTNGRPTQVQGIYPRGRLEMAMVTFSDGSSVRCSWDHLWAVRTRKSKLNGNGFRILSTRQIASDVENSTRYYIPITRPVAFDRKYLSVHPYLLGVLVGDGGLKYRTPYLTTADEEIVERVCDLLPCGMELKKVKGSKYDYRVVMSQNVSGGPTNKKKNVLNAQLQRLGLTCLSHSKFIPRRYLFGAVYQRIHLLQGLMDTDGSVAGASRTTLEYSTTSERLAMDVKHLVESLGGTCVVRQRKTKCNGKYFDSFRLHFAVDPQVRPFTLTRKLRCWRPASKYFPSRGIESVVPDGFCEALCIRVGDTNGLYITENFIVTHNTILAEGIRRATCKAGQHGLYCSAEMSDTHLVSRGLAAQAGVKQGRMRRIERLTREDKENLANAAMDECPFCTIKHGELSLVNIRMAAQRLKTVRGSLGVVVVDYDELINAPGKDEFEQQKNLVRGLKRLAVLVKAPVVMVSQLRKPLSPSEAKKPSLARIYGVGAKSKHSSVVIFVDRPWVRDLKGNETEAQIYILKHRDGRKCKIDATFDVQKLRFAGKPKEQEPADRED